VPIEVGVWQIVENKARKIDFSAMELESRLEDILADDISIINPDILLIGRQVTTSYGKFIDLLAIDANGNLIVIELKRNRTPREVIAQLLDYGSWVRDLEDDDIASIFSDYVRSHCPIYEGKSLDQVFCEKFNINEMPASLNESHELIVVAGELDDSTERIINYLADEYGVAINAVFFRFFKNGEQEYLTRAWMIDPGQAEIIVEKKREKLPWNGEYYVSFGGENRNWEEARKYGFISAGGGSWYSRTLGILEPEGRIWVNIPGGIGYVGVGRVLESAIPIDEFKVNDGQGNQVGISSLGLEISKCVTYQQSVEKAEYMVRVDWIKTVPVNEAIKEKGFFGNQNSAAKPRSKMWIHTVERLKKRFEIE
jgi:hypothetical protein